MRHITWIEDLKGIFELKKKTSFALTQLERLGELRTRKDRWS